MDRPPIAFYRSKNFAGSTSRAVLIFLSVSTVILVLPDSIRDMLAFSKLHWTASSIWLMFFSLRNCLIFSPNLAKYFSSVMLVFKKLNIRKIYGMMVVLYDNKHIYVWLMSTKSKNWRKVNERTLKRYGKKIEIDF